MFLPDDPEGFPPHCGMIPGRVLRPGLLAIWMLAVTASAQQFPANWRLGHTNLAAYFEAEVARLESACLADVKTAADWTGQRDERRRQLFDMLGLWPLPDRTDLKPVVTGKVEGDGFTVEKLHFQSMPGLYVTANLYLPANPAGPAPAILYVCGHADVKTNGVSLGNKTFYQHHGAWLARHGYVCLTIDTLQLGEIQGDHHGTYRLGQWWWNSRGYTPAGVEAWNGIRALDYLETRPEVDRARIGMTGRSGGGSYTWTTAALDERIKAAAPVAGITDLRNHVCDGSVEGHCDCMFFVNTHRWDFPLNAALIAPRPLLIVNTDADGIVPLDGVNRLFTKTRRIYGILGAYEKLGLVVGPGGHADSQNLQVPVLRWFNQHLKVADPLITEAAKKPFAPAQLRVFGPSPADQRNTTAQEFFGARPLESIRTLEALRGKLGDGVFMGWPDAPGLLQIHEGSSATNTGLRLRSFTFQSQVHVPLRLFSLAHGGRPIRKVELRVVDEAGWAEWLASARSRFKELAAEFPATNAATATASFPEPATGTAVIVFAPRGLGPDVWPGDARKQAMIRRRFQLLGQSLDGMRVWDVRRALAAIRELHPGVEEVAVSAAGPMAAHALHGAAFEDRPLRLELSRLPASYREGVDYLNVAKLIGLAQVPDLVRSRHTVTVGP